MYAYIHGLNSDGKRSFKNLSEFLDGKFFNLSWECDRPFDENLAYLISQCEELEEAYPPEDPFFEFFVLIGSSMGGYYASVLSSIKLYPCALFNPVVYPQKTLQKFKGPNTNFATGKKYELTQELIDSYNFSGNLHKYGISRSIILGRNDEVLDYREAEEFYRGIGHTVITDNRHQIVDYSPFKAMIETLNTPVLIYDDED